MNVTRAILVAGFGLSLIAGPAAFAATTSEASTPHHSTAKGAAVGGLAGHEMGKGHALAGAGVGAAIGHHHKKKMERQNHS